MKSDLLTVEDAYKAMICFIEKYNSILRAEEIFVMLSSMDLQWTDPRTKQLLPGDPVLWKEWLACIEKVKVEK